jgi:hypothetical protein
MAVFLQPTTVRGRPTMVRTTSVGVLSYTSHPSLRGVPSVPVALRSWFNALFRVVLDAVDRAVDSVGFHMRPLPCDGLLMQVSQS